MAGTRKAPSPKPWIAGAAGDVVVRPHSSGGDWHRGANPGADAVGGGGGGTGRELVAARREVHVIPTGEQDWIVRADTGRELGHYPSLEAAEAVGRKLARRDRGELLVYDSSGRIADRSRPSSGWFARLLGR
jgi:Uncharacterized protein conserved in bacteria (DUF2188)